MSIRIAVPAGPADTTNDHAAKIAGLVEELQDSLSRNSAAGALTAISDLRSVLGPLEVELQGRFIAELAEMLAGASGNAALHAWAEPDGSNFRCTGCQLTASPKAVREAAVPVCAPDSGCEHFVVPLWDTGDSAHCLSCKTVYPSTAGSEQAREVTPRG